VDGLVLRGWWSTSGDVMLRTLVGWCGRSWDPRSPGRWRARTLTAVWCHATRAQIGGAMRVDVASSHDSATTVDLAIRTMHEG